MFDRVLGARPLESVLAGATVLFRVAACGWLVVLALVTLSTDEGADRAIVIATIGLATVWTGLTVVASSRGLLRRPWFGVADGVVAVLVAASPFVAGSAFTFFGGMPFSWMVVAAYIGGSWWALGSAAVLTVTVIATGSVGGITSATSAVGYVLVFLIPAVLIGWVFDTLRFTERQRRQTEASLLAERTERAKQAERADMATRLHDSVLQTLAVIEDRTDEPETRNLARRERHAVRRLIDSLSFGGDASFKGRLLEVADEVEEKHLISIETAFVGNRPIDDGLSALCSVAREALTNAAKHSGERRVSLFAEVSDSAATITVKDGATRVMDDRVRAGLEDRLTRRLPAGGTVKVDSTTEFTIVEAHITR